MLDLRGFLNQYAVAGEEIVPVSAALGRSVRTVMRITGCCPGGHVLVGEVDVLHNWEDDPITAVRKSNSYAHPYNVPSGMLVIAPAR